RAVEIRQMAEVAMTSPAATSQEVPKRLWQLSQRRVRGVLVLFLGCLALAAPFFAGPLTLFLGGSLLILCGVLEMWETFRAPDDSSLRSAYLSGELSVLAGILLLSTPDLVLKGVALLLAASFLIDGIGKAIASLRAKTIGTSRTWLFAAGVVNVGL